MINSSPITGLKSEGLLHKLRPYYLHRNVYQWHSEWNIQVTVVYSGFLTPIAKTCSHNSVCSYYYM